MPLKKLLSLGEVLIIVVLALVPVFASFPYRLNIFLSWEGAYRLYLGQTPYKDFGTPVGYMYWVVPAMFFKIFGPQMITLVKAQAFLNIVGGLAFRSIFKTLQINETIRFTGVLLFVLSYSFFNYWPWYNHTVIIYELVALAFLMKYFFAVRLRWLWLALAGVFIFFSFFTKQDGGGLALLVCLGLLLYEAIKLKKWLPLLVFMGAVVITGLIVILPLRGYNFGYWFNHGQPPHTSRMSISDIIREILAGSQWLKFYVFIIVLLLIARWQQRGWKEFWNTRQEMLMGLLTIGILAQAAIFQVTSYVPVDNNIFFHSFALVYILYLLNQLLPLRFDTWKVAIVCAGGVLLWWSQVYWKYIERFVIKPGQAYNTIEYKGYRYATEVNRNTYMIDMDTTDIPLHQWRTVNLRSFNKMLLPGPTADGIERLMNMDLIKNKNKNLKVLNMTELTPLAAEVPFELERGSHYPLWFHKGVGMFDKETNMFCDRIKSKYYDMVLFEYIPYLNNFYPYQVRECLEQNYKKIDSFVAPRKPTPNAWVEVWVK
ncbi:MAG TPA: hypothetical protein VD993_18630 [Chitinophagaceae bacterium]|nr:hypothetical protein [Chitinophagaceae bacterium]